MDGPGDLFTSPTPKADFSTTTNSGELLCFMLTDHIFKVIQTQLNAKANQWPNQAPTLTDLIS